MAGGVMMAAWIQAVPVWVAAGVGIYGLTTWRRQLRGERHLEHAELALASARQTITLIRDARSRFSPRTERFPTPDARLYASRQNIGDRLERAWAAWRDFQSHYVLASMFAKPAKDRMDVATELADCLRKLSIHAEVMFIYDWDKADVPNQTGAAGRHAGEFYAPLEPDQIELRLRDAQRLLSEQLEPVIRAPTLQQRLHHAAIPSSRRVKRPSMIRMAEEISDAS